MKLPLSKRLLTCCNMVAQGDRVADIGCDHGYLGIYLLTKGIASRVIAADINEGPLSTAVVNAEKYGVREKIQFYLSDGVKNIPRDFDTLVCAGMGADVMISIINAAPWLRDRRYRLILQCQSRTPQLRKYLSDNGWYIRRETVLKDGRFLYTVMEVIPESGHELSPGECYITPALLAENDAQLSAYCSWVEAHLEIAIKGQGDNADPMLKNAYSELKNTVFAEKETPL